jgi:4-amino-4-deoxy-L-arabinose transferase-like glycosyltransferase
MIKGSLVKFFSNKTFQIIFLVYSSLLTFLGRQLDRGITNFDGAYYAIKAREIFLSDSLWVVTWGGIAHYFDNPPLPFWLTGLAYKAFGVSGYGAVFSSAIFGVLIVYLTYSLCNYLYKDNWTSFLASFVLLFPGLFLDSSRRAMLDITLAFFVTASMYCLIKGLENRKFFLLYGLMTGCAVLTKSLLGFFPILIGVVFMFWHGGFKKLFDPGFIASVLLALLVGCSWYLVNWYIFGDLFIERHFKSTHMKLIPQGFLENPLYVFGYLKDMARNYWPWFPITVAGIFLFAKSSFKEKNFRSMFLFLWVSIPFVVMSTSRNQTLRYLFMIFPAFGIITAHTLASWLKDSQKEKALPWMFGIVMTVVLVINVTPVQVKVSLNQNNSEVRNLAPFVHLNTKPGEKIFNYGFTPWNPRQVLAFYSGRFIEHPVKNAETLMQKLDENPKGTWLSPVSKFKELKKNFPGELYLIYGNEKFAYFTSIKNRENISYNFFNTKLPIVR